MDEENPYYSGPSTNVVDLVAEILTWRLNNSILYPNDVLNMLVDHSFVTKYDIDRITENYKPKQLKLPTQHI